MNQATNWANTIIIFSFNFVFDKYVNHKPVSLVMLYSFSIIQYIVIDHLFVFWVLNCQGTSLVYIVSFLNLSNSITEILTSFFVFCICIFAGALHMFHVIDLVK